MNPSASAPSSTAKSASSRFVIPQILILTFIPSVCHPEQSEGPRNSRIPGSPHAEILRSAQNDTQVSLHDFPNSSLTFAAMFPLRIRRFADENRIDARFFETVHVCP